MSGSKKKKKLWLVPAVVCTAGILAGLIMVYQAIQGKQAAAKVTATAEDSSYDTDTSSAGSITWNGKTYRYNDHISNFLFLGIDNEELVDTSVGHADAGQSDAIFLLAWDRVEGDLTLISIPRDTMTSYNVYDRGGTNLGTATYHLNLAYAYGDGKHESCKNTADAVSNLMYGLNIQGYCAISLDALTVLMDEIDSLTVTVPNDSLESKYPEYQEGTEVVLTQDNVEVFVRYRDITVSQTALMRLERQKAFLKAYMERAEECFAQDAGFVTRLYTAMEPYMVTNMGNDQFVKMMESAAGGAVIEEWTLPGEGVEGEQYDEFYVDDDALYEKMIETFYIEEE